MHPALERDPKREQAHLRRERMAVEQAPARSVLNAVGEEGVPVREIAQAIGRNLNLPVKSLPAEEYAGVLVPLLSTDMSASSAITRSCLAGSPFILGLSRTSNRATTSSDHSRRRQPCMPAGGRSLVP